MGTVISGVVSVGVCGAFFASVISLPPTQGHARSIKDECLFTYEHVCNSVRYAAVARTLQNVQKGTADAVA
jgi:hypothetical protein